MRVVRPDGSFCLASEDLPIVTFPDYVAAGHYLYLDTYSAAGAYLFVIDARNCATIWQSPHWDNNGFRRTATGFIFLVPAGSKLGRIACRRQFPASLYPVSGNHADNQSTMVTRPRAFRVVLISLAMLLTASCPSIAAPCSLLPATTWYNTIFAGAYRLQFDDHDPPGPHGYRFVSETAMHIVRPNGSSCMAADNVGIVTVPLYIHDHCGRLPPGV